MKKCKPEEGLALLEILNVFSGKWKILILGALYTQEIRFTEIKKLIPAITSRMLSRELKDLEMSGLVKRTVDDSGRVLIKYELTESAKGLSEIGLMEWALEHRKISKANLGVS
ncbi:helix-turn-helix domain-containing protein [Pedobacter sp. L105]|uniref:winged helix-turn-helix transcriptional regulator n=1 Tax=Pedobacter sp. L105 TaxID=1641871 RepID=UPI001C205982|nr:helix-turn-helix domain-containing protein [Pedobacter sp. L105]